MVMIMGLALMVYSIAERKLREALEKAGETISDQRGKPTQKPTIRRVFQVFEGITVLYKGSEMVAVLNMKPIHYKVLSLLGHEYERMYCITGRYTFVQFKEGSNAKRSGRRRLIHFFSSSLQNRVEIGGEKNKIAMTRRCEHTHV